MIAHIDHKRRRRRIVDEVVADRLGLPGLAIGFVSSEAGAEDGLGQQMAGRDVIRMTIGPVGHRHDTRPCLADQARDGPQLVRVASNRAVRQPQVHTPRSPEHVTRGVGFRQALRDRAVAAHLARRQVAEAHAMAKRGVLGNKSANANLDVVGMRSDGQEIDRRERGLHRVQPKTSSCLSGWPLAARARMRAARNAPERDCPPRAKR